MGDRVYKKIQIVGTSAGSIEDAVTTAIAKASETESGLSWFEVAEIRGAIGDNGKVQEYQVTLNVGVRTG